MAKTTTALTQKGKPVTYKPNRASRKATLIPLTAAPKTTGQKIARALWG